MSWVNREKTELSVAPQEWGHKRLSQIAQIKSGEGITSEDIAESGSYPCYGGNGVRGFVDSFNREGDHSLVGRQGALCGNVKRVTGRYFASEHAVVFQPQEGILNSWLYYKLDSMNLNRFSESSAQPGLAVSKVSTLKVAVPPTNEQQKIGEILSTWDKSIEATERLLENSKKRKKALMQQLLTGKKRLPGFTKAWSCTELGSLFTERVERNRPDLPLLSISGEYGLQDQEVSGRRDTSNDDKSKYLRITTGDIGYNTMRMWQGRCCLADREGIVSPAYTIVCPKGACSSEFMFHLFKLPQTINEFYKYSQGLVSDTWNLKFEQFSKIKVNVPELDEQIRVAELITEFESDLELIKCKLDLLRKEKAALMQQLLTGKKRVKVEEAA